VQTLVVARHLCSISSHRVQANRLRASSSDKHDVEVASERGEFPRPEPAAAAEAAAGSYRPEAT